MKNNGEVAQEWITKAESDFAAAGLCINGAVALETATFHCEQAVA